LASPHRIAWRDGQPDISEAYPAQGGNTHVVVGKHPGGARPGGLGVFKSIVDRLFQLVCLPLAHEEVERESLAQTFCGGIEVFVIG